MRAGAGAGLIAEGTKLAGSAVVAWLVAEATDGDSPSTEEEDDLCLEPRVEPWELETEIGSRGEQLTADEHFVDKLNSVSNSNPEAPGPGGSPKAKAVKAAALLAILYDTLRHR